MGVMIESHLIGGRQEVIPGKTLAHGQSITDVPNLRRQAIDSFLYIFKRRVLGVDLDPPSVSAIRRTWLALYGLARMAYTVLVIATIFTLIAFKAYLVGIVFAVAFVVTMVWRWAVRAITYLLRSPETAPVRYIRRQVE